MIVALSGYAGFGLVFGYYAFWLAGTVVPWTINGNALFDVTQNMGEALLLNSALIGAFLIPHSFMARPAFKRWWTQFVPKPIERAVYVWYSNLSLLAMMVFWQPVEAQLWAVGGIASYAIYGLYALGAVVIVIATFCIDHFALFGLKQAALKGDAHGAFHVRVVYKLVRHPIALGHLMMIWAVPVMSVGHMLYTLLASVYIVLVTFKYEERDLIDAIGPAYNDYIKTTPGIVPFAKPDKS